MIKRETWVMPEWMERYRHLIGETGGNTVESLMNNHSANSFNNVILAGLIVCVNAQVQLLNRLHNDGLLSD